MKIKYKKRLLITLISIVLFMTIVAVFKTFSYVNEIRNYELVKPSAFMEFLEKDKIDTVNFRKGYILFKLLDNPTQYYCYDSGSDEVYMQIMNSNAEINVIKGLPFYNMIDDGISIFGFFVSSSLIALVGILLIKQVLPPKRNHEVNYDTKVSFDDIVGLEDIKKELLVVKDMLENHDIYTSEGIRIPKGILLEGEPGNGKTLLAKGFAHECGMGFISVNASDIGGILVGRGRDDLKKIFNIAEKNKPCLIFIDEIDCIGSKRKDDSHHDDILTLTTLLTFMDGFKTTDRILIIAATNRCDTLDSAILRPGRFDKVFTVTNPNTLARHQLFSKNLNYSEDFNIERAVKLTKGMSSAAIVSAINESKIDCIRNSRHKITNEDLENVILKREIKGHQTCEDNETDLRTVAYHEAGHAVGDYLVDKDSIFFVSVLPTTSGIGGFVFSTISNGVETIGDVEKHIVSLFMGMASEYVLHKSNQSMVSLGARNDIERATKLIKELCCMQSSFPFDYDSFSSEDNQLLKSQELAESLWKEAISIVTNRWEYIDKLAQALMEKKILKQKDVESILCDLK